MRVQFVMVGVSLLMNITLIPVFGVVGAALASATVNVAGNFWNLMQVRKALQISPYNRSYFALAIPAVFAAAPGRRAVCHSGGLADEEHAFDPPDGNDRIAAAAGGVLATRRE